jgi:hypothetical protein
MAVAGRRRSCAASSPPVSGPASIRLPGFTTCSRASRRTPSPGSANCFPTLEAHHFPRPRIINPPPPHSGTVPSRGLRDACRKSVDPD